MKAFFNKIKNIFFGKTIAQRLFQGYLITLVIGSLLLLLPFASVSGAPKIKFIDSLFISASACSDTGLTTLTMSNQFTFFGQLIILILVQIGGIGILSLKIIFLLFLGKKIRLKERLFSSNERGNGKLGGSIDLIKTSLLVIFMTEIFAALATFLRLVCVSEYRDMFKNLGQLIWVSIFHGVSSVNNAGFDIFPVIDGQSSLMVFKSDYFIQIITMISLIIGGIGFPIFYDIKNYIKAKRKKEVYHLSLFTKFSLQSYFIIGGIGLVLVFASELLAGKSGFLFANNGFSIADKIFALIFQTVSTRNAGFATINLNMFANSTNFILIILMFIGAAPASTGGGLRCTTFFLVIYLLKSTATGADRVEVCQRTIPKKTIEKAISIFITGIVLIVFGTLALLFINNKTFSLTEVMFEVASAFGTTGLTLGITTQLNVLSKIILIFIMFIGYVGISTSLLIWSDRKVVKNLRTLPEEDLPIG